MQTDSNAALFHCSELFGGTGAAKDEPFVRPDLLDRFGLVAGDMEYALPLAGNLTDPFRLFTETVDGIAVAPSRANQELPGCGRLRQCARFAFPDERFGAFLVRKI